MSDESDRCGDVTGGRIPEWWPRCRQVVRDFDGRAIPVDMGEQVFPIRGDLAFDLDMYGPEGGVRSLVVGEPAPWSVKADPTSARLASIRRWRSV